MRSELSNAFLTHFTLSPELTAVVESRDGIVDERLFTAIGRLARIRADCTTLFATAVGASTTPVHERGEDESNGVDGKIPDSGDDTDQGGEGQDPALAAKEIMALASTRLESAYTTLYHHLVTSFRHYTTAADHLVQVRPTVTKALDVCLSSRPSLASEALEVLTRTRQSAILDAFMHALTRGSGSDGQGGGSAGRPIEWWAHDTLRYIGDMLSWVHQAVAGEQEFLEALFGFATESSRRPSTFDTTLDELTPSTLKQKHLTAHLANLSRPLEVRIGQTISSTTRRPPQPQQQQQQQQQRPSSADQSEPHDSSHHDIRGPAVVMTYRIAELVLFYRTVLGKRLGTTDGLGQTLGE